MYLTKFYATNKITNKKKTKQRKNNLWCKWPKITFQRKSIEGEKRQKIYI